LLLRKITGDPNVPAGRVSVKLDNVPELDEKTTAKIMIRTDRYDPTDFNWHDSGAICQSYDMIITDHKIYAHDYEKVDVTSRSSKSMQS
jgi:hypothetical protein